VPFIAGFAAAIVVGAVVGAAVSSLTLRLSGDYLAIVTLGFAETVRLVINNEDWLTRGPRGFIISDMRGATSSGRNTETPQPHSAHL
jgi:branched-chain amino acid transport system permease protein